MSDTYGLIPEEDSAPAPCVVVTDEDMAELERLSDPEFQALVNARTASPGVTANGTVGI